MHSLDNTIGNWHSAAEENALHTDRKKALLVSQYWQHVKLASELRSWLAPEYHWRKLPQVSFLLRQIFLETNIILSRQAYLRRNKLVFVAIKHVFCHDKSMLVATKPLWHANSIFSGHIFSTSTFNAIRFDENPFTCQCEKEDKNALKKWFQNWPFCWSFPSDIMAVKGLKQTGFGYTRYEVTFNHWLKSESFNPRWKWNVGSSCFILVV